MRTQSECGDFPHAAVTVHEGPFRHRPSATDLAKRFGSLAEFEALNLGRFLGSPDGQFLRVVVVQALPQLASIDVDLIVESLTLAAQAQSRGKHQVAAALNLVAALYAGLAIRGHNAPAALGH